MERFVRSGGQLVTTYWSGIVDESDRCFSGGVPHGLREVVGLRSTEIDGLYDWERNYMVPASGEKGERYECRNLCDLVRLDGAEALMVYENDFYKGYPALTRNHYGKGMAYYVCADGEQDFYDDLFWKVACEAGIKPLVEGLIPEEVEVTSRESDQYEYLFLQNFSRQPAVLEQKLLDSLSDGRRLLGEISGRGEIEPYGTVIIRRDLHRS